MLRNALVILLIAAIAVIAVPVILVLPAIALCVSAPLHARRSESPRVSFQRLALFRILPFRAPPAFA